MTGWIYILHFHTKLSHAEHYAGCTTDLHRRLLKHANGAGSRLCRALWEEGITWSVGSLSCTTSAEMRRLERSLKDQHNSSRYCGICTTPPQRIPGTTPYPLEMVRFPMHSGQFTRPEKGPEQITVRFTTGDEPDKTKLFTLDLMRKDKDALGFIPAGKETGLTSLFSRGLVAIVANNGEDVGYMAFTISADEQRLNIHQCVVRDDARLCGHAKAMIDTVATKFPYHTLAAKVRSDLAANHFWVAMAFELIHSRRHATSGSTINIYIRLPASNKGTTCDT